MIKAIAIDDELLALRILEKYSQQVTDLCLEESFTDPQKALAYLEKEAVDVLFLDINMPELDGLSLINLLDRPIPVIFTTAYPEYAVDSYEYKALDYLLKPFSQERFAKAVEKVREKRAVVESTTSANAYLIVRADRKVYRLAYQEIQYLQAFGDYVKIKTNSQLIVPKITLAKLEQQLPEGLFLRTHRTYLINTDKVEYLEGNQVAIGEEKIPISKHLKEGVLAKLGF